MKKVASILVVFFTLLSVSSYGQFWKKKTEVVSASSGGSSAPNYRDAFSGKSKKGANIISRGGPKNKSKSAIYLHSISKKKFKLNNASVFSSSKRRYKGLSTGSSKEESTKRLRSARKSGKGRKK